MKNAVCPGCGAGYNGRRCRRCGYETFPEAAVRSTKPAAPITKKQRKKHPLIGFLILLYLIWSLLPLVKEWGLKLEAMEEAARPGGYHSREVPHG